MDVRCPREVSIGARTHRRLVAETLTPFLGDAEMICRMLPPKANGTMIGSF